MSKVIKDNISELRAYLLGLTAKDAIEAVEKKFLLDPEGFENLLDDEEDLIEDYLDGELSPKEAEAFRNHFLASEDRREKLELIRLLKEHASERTLAQVPAKDAIEKKKKFRNSWMLFPVAAAIFGIIAAGGYLLAKLEYFRTTSGETPIVSLNKAYEKNRPFDARISGFQYAPYDPVRGNEPSSENPTVNANLERARLLAIDEYLKRPNVQSRHSLAMVYLANREFDKALQLLKEAQETGPEAAKILSDTGVAYLEKAEDAVEGEKKIDLVASAIDIFDQALALDPDFLPAHFNKALALEIYLPNRAKEEWREYLEKDQTSGWATEARRRLETLNKEGAGNFSTAEELELAFAAAHSEGNEDRALEIISQNREIIGEKYLPQKLAADITQKKTKKIENSNC